MEEEYSIISDVDAMVEVARSGTSPPEEKINSSLEAAEGPSTSKDINSESKTFPKILYAALATVAIALLFVMIRMRRTRKATLRRQQDEPEIEQYKDSLDPELPTLD